MSSRRHPIYSAGNHEYLQCISWAPAGAGAPTDLNGSGFTVVRTSQGLFTVTLTDPAVRVRSAVPGLQLAAADNMFPQLGSIDVATAKTVEVRVVDETGAVQDVAADANNRVHLTMTLTRDTVTR